MDNHRIKTLPLDASAFTHLSPLIEKELARALAGVRVGEFRTPSMTTTLQRIFVHLFGSERTAEERMRFLVFAAPLMRRAVIGSAGSGGRIGDTHISAAELAQWLWRLETFDPLCVRMIDLHYFAGLSARETAAALGLSPESVLRDLRFAKAWLRARMHWAATTP